VHHIVFHSHGGPTVLANLIGLCGFHHRRIHDSTWRLDGDPGGVVTFRSPMGVELTSHPPDWGDP
jgi:nitrate reductase gamma subunit